MQIGVQDIRRWGYKKIFGDFCKTEESKRALFARLLILGVDKCACPAFSLPKIWNELDSDVLSKYCGMLGFMHMCEPMIDNIEVDTSVQRRVRNQWGSIWGKFGQDVGLEVDEIAFLMECGMGLCFMRNAPDDILRFFNSVLLWGIFSQSESNFSAVDVTAFQVIEDLVVLETQDFIAKIEGYIISSGRS